MNIDNTPVISLLGIPLDSNSSYMRGPAEAPARIREALRCASSNTWSESGKDIAALLSDAGDVPLVEQSGWLGAIEGSVSDLLQAGVTPLVLGGDHSISYPVVKAFSSRYPGLTIIHFDAHPDLYDEFEGNRYSHACPFARIMEERLARRLVQVGIRTLNAHLRTQAARFGAEVIEMKRWKGALPQLEAPLYLSFDMDVLDPAFAPGISHHEPGGMSTREAISAIQSISARIVGADIVELNPGRDINGVTAMAAAKILKEIAAKILSPTMANPLE
jgi:arginase